VIDRCLAFLKPEALGYASMFVMDVALKSQSDEDILKFGKSRHGDGTVCRGGPFPINLSVSLAARDYAADATGASMPCVVFRQFSDVTELIQLPGTNLGLVYNTRVTGVSDRASDT
tara:strand:- start:15565 stop:15912 length:348 start_codon:yes stop_codon:yes gene_type:complete